MNWPWVSRKRLEETERYWKKMHDVALGIAERANDEHKKTLGRYESALRANGEIENKMESKAAVAQQSLDALVDEMHLKMVWENSIQRALEQTPRRIRMEPMDKIKIDDAMVERFFKAGGCYQRGKDAAQCVREGLEAALNPPAEPEIEVTDEMVNAGRHCLRRLDPAAHSAEVVTEIYRAMRKLEPVREPPKACEHRKTEPDRRGTRWRRSGLARRKDGV